jgi:hypothetical protein
MKLTILTSNLVLGLRERGAIPPLPVITDNFNFTIIKGSFYKVKLQIIIIIIIISSSSSSSIGLQVGCQPGGSGNTILRNK